MSQKFTNKRGTLIILSIFIFALLIFIGIILNSNQNFNNNNLQGNYSGTLTIDNQEIITLNITFDGAGHLNASMDVEGEIITLQDEYTCFGQDVTFSYDFNDKLLHLFGTLSEDKAVINGELRMYYGTEGNYYNGTFFLSKY